MAPEKTTMTSFTLSFLLVVAAAVNTAAGNIFLKYSRLATVGQPFFESLFSVYFLLGITCYAVNVIVFVKALEGMPLSIAYPVLASLGFALVVLASMMLFDERLSALQWAGLALILCGIVLLVSKGAPSV